MKKYKISKIHTLLFIILWLALSADFGFAQPVPFATNGTLKMLYDLRMNPQALEHNNRIYIVWRGENGFPYITTYDLRSRFFSKPLPLPFPSNYATKRKIKRDQHFSPVVWADKNDHLHVLFGCHRTPGIHLASKNPEDINEWVKSSIIHESISYPQVHQIYDNSILVYFRHSGHLGHWTYRISSDNGVTWKAPENPIVDLNSEPQDGLMASHAGSYHSTCLSKDGKTLHVAFSWKVEEKIMNSRYNSRMTETTRRYNLYYLKIDLVTGKVKNYEGKSLETPVSKKVAEEECLICDTNERILAVAPSIYIHKKNEPCFLFSLSEETPYKCMFYFVNNTKGVWQKKSILRTNHTWNACLLDKSDNGTFKAYLVVGDEQFNSEENMDAYGWGARIELWESTDQGENWTLAKNLTPGKNYKYQNVKFVSKGIAGINEDIILFYGWQSSNGNGTAFLLDKRKSSLN